MKSKVKTPNASTSPQGLSKSCHWSDLLSENAWKHNPEKDGWRARLRYTILEYFGDDTHLEFDEFCRDYKIAPRTFRFWKSKYPDLKETVDSVTIFLGLKRRLGCHINKYNMASCYKDMHTLDPDWGTNVDKYHSELKKAEEQLAREYNVTLLKAKEPLKENNGQAPLD